MEIQCVFACTFACVLSDVDTKLNDVARENLTGRTLLRTTTQPLAVDERPVAAFSVLQVELTHTNTAGENCEEINKTYNKNNRHVQTSILVKIIKDTDRGERKKYDTRWR